LQKYAADLAVENGVNSNNRCSNVPEVFGDSEGIDSRDVAVVCIPVERGDVVSLTVTRTMQHIHRFSL